MERTCVSCGKTFSTDNASKFYCDDACRHKYYENVRSGRIAVIPKTKVCECCGKEFDVRSTGRGGRNIKYCSAECSKKGYELKRAEYILWKKEHPTTKKVSDQKKTGYGAFKELMDELGVSYGELQTVERTGMTFVNGGGTLTLNDGIYTLTRRGREPIVVSRKNQRKVKK